MLLILLIGLVAFMLGGLCGIAVMALARAAADDPERHCAADAWGVLPDQLYVSALNGQYYPIPGARRQPLASDPSDPFDPPHLCWHPPIDPRRCSTRALGGCGKEQAQCLENR